MSQSPSDSESGPSVPAETRTEAFNPEDHLTPAVLEAGARIGRYNIEACLGEGGMGVVYRAHDPELNRTVAIKLLKNPEPDAIHRIRREAAMQARVEHRGICPIYEIGEHHGRPYLVMRYVSGGSLRDHMASLNLQQKLALMQRVAEALHAAHRKGLIHRDIKPSNILIEPDEQGGYHPFITDFGLAREVHAEGITVTGIVMGTPHYMPPEQAYGEIQQLDRRSDVYSLGASLFELLCGEPPFKGETSLEVLMKVVDSPPQRPRSLRRSIPRDVEIIVLKCLEKHPDDRYASARALAEDIERYLNDEPIQAARKSIWKRGIQWARRNRMLSTVMLGSTVMMVTLLGWGLHQWWTARERARLAQVFGQQARELEAVTRFEHMLPQHDIRPGRAERLRKLGALEKTIGRLPARVRAPGYYAMGRAWMAMDRPEKARAALEEALKGNYSVPEVNYSYGRVMTQIYERAVEAAYRLSDRKAREKALAEARRDLRQTALTYLVRGRMQAVEPETYSQALLAFNRDQYSRVIRLLKGLRKRQPWFYESTLLEAAAYRRMGDRHRDRGQHQAAIVAYDRAARVLGEAREIAPSDPRVYDQSCELYSSRLEMEIYGRGKNLDTFMQLGTSACGDGLAVDPENIDLLNTRARIRFKYAFYEMNLGHDVGGHLQAAERDYLRVLQLDQNNDTAVEGLGVLNTLVAFQAMRTGKDARRRLKQAVAYYDRAIGRHPNRDSLYNNRGNAYLFLAGAQSDRGEDPLNSLEQAVASYQKALEIAPENFMAAANKGVAYHRLADRAWAVGEDPRDYLQKSLQSTQRAVELNPSDPYTLNNSGNIHIKLAEVEMAAGQRPAGLLEEAEKELQRALEINPELDEPYYNRARINRMQAELALGNRAVFHRYMKQARAMLDRAIRVNPEKAEFYVERARQAFVLLFHGDDPRAVLTESDRAIRQALRLIPGDAESRYYQIRIRHMRSLLGRGSNRAAIAAALLPATRELVERNPAFEEVRLYRVGLWLAWSRGTREGACAARAAIAADLERLRRMAPRHELARSFLTEYERVTQKCDHRTGRETTVPSGSETILAPWIRAEYPEFHPVGVQRAAR